ncbi:MAG TPA: amidohydrolase family protein [Nocardioides sp.]|uniref:amidohydrolase family protein n=1 Tax=uncultured Nocardioides sp. TaxID=198441 RepID=UPI000EE566F8|nr:amidohydrolase family protein [uncultured Nocardioides sp.]HCB05110.1 hypothetical protein [Nocardioides sp.]HRD59973.1 amidohydrolase family protein [Nocardioides sp.]HRI94143.1 amidohydrolase family protein [Nocardioides sp.]HRK44193.1 amidohydrolase family protein [Nocardioides sp.]
MTSTAGHRAIDVHGHCVPRSFLEDVAGSAPRGVAVASSDDGYVVTLPRGLVLRPVRGAMIDGPLRGAWMDAQGVGHQVVAPWLDVQGQELAAADGARWVTLLNDHLAAAVAADARLSAHATLHLRDPEAAAVELRRAIGELGMRGVMLPCTLPDGRLADRGFDALWSVAVELDVPVILHATTRSPAAALLAEYPSLRGLFARHVETSLVTAELIVTGVLDRFPGLKLVNVHGGGLLPYQTGRFDNDLGDGARRLPSEVLRTMYFDSVLLTAPALRYLVDVMGADRVLLGSDYGATPTERAGVSILSPVRDLDDAAAEAVARGNAMRLFMGLTQTGLGNNYNHAIHHQTEHLAFLVDRMRAAGASRIDVSLEAEAWYERLVADRAMDDRAFWDQCIPSRLNNQGNVDNPHGRTAGRFPGSAIDFWELMADWRSGPAGELVLS